MKVVIDSYNTAGYQKEMFTTYNYLEELTELLGAFNMKFGKNNRSGIDFEIVDNGGETSLYVPNYNGVSVSIPFSLSGEWTKEKYWDMVEPMIQKIISNIERVSEHMKAFSLEVK